MKKFKRFLSDLFKPEYMNDLDMDVISSAFNDSGVRTVWLNACFEELRRINEEVDRRLLTENMYGLTDLCARRKAYQDVLTGILSARRIVTHGVPHNPPSKVVVDLDRVTG